MTDGISNRNILACSAIAFIKRISGICVYQYRAKDIYIISYFFFRESNFNFESNGDSLVDCIDAQTFIKYIRIIILRGDSCHPVSL